MIALGVAAVVVGGPMVMEPVEGAVVKVQRTVLVAAQKRIHEKRALKLIHVRQRKLGRAHANKLLARAMMARHGWRQATQYRCLEQLWARESGWNEHSHNASTGAHGIPQALPGSKMGSAGPNWQSNPRTQIKWGLRYVKYRYGSPCAAWGHFQAAGWY
ncbi:hypothetical protein ACGFNU_41735 [Spirillospora sp. NPDC048911]|uniref:aggregation-promoting factor C-terminal-like domain-containing protein n=1 Tax=Spirillospora sp. NPDC048911 TaxID=3364527 RepID=UPI0037237553